MSLSKITEYFRYLLIVVVLIFLTRKIYQLELKVESLSAKVNSPTDYVEEYNTDNDTDTYNYEVLKKMTELKQQLQEQESNNAIKNSIFIHTVQEKQPEKVNIIIRDASEIVETDKTGNLVNDVIINDVTINDVEQTEEPLTIVASSETNTLKSLTIAELRELAQSKNIDIKINGKNKTKKQLIIDLSK